MQAYYPRTITFFTLFKWLPHFALCLVFAFILITAGGQTIGYDKFWAFSHLLYVATWLRWTLLLALLTVATFSSSRLLQTGWHHIVTVFCRVPDWLLIVFAGLGFWLLRERTHHGDAMLKLHLLSTETLQTDPYIWKEPLDSLIAYTLVSFLRMFGQSPIEAITLSSIFAGVVYIAVVILLSKELSDRPTYRVMLFIGLTALGTSQLWFGHIENYSLVTSASTLSILFAIYHLRGRGKLWPVGLISGLAISFHPQAIFIMPALICLLSGWRERRWIHQMVILALTSSVVPLVTIALLLSMQVPIPSFADGYAGDPQLFLSISQATSLQQVGDALNNLWLLVPFLPLILWVVAGLTKARQIYQDRVFIYLSVLVISLLTYFFAFQNDLPRYRDWDLFAIVAPAMALWLLYTWLQLNHLGESPMRWATLSTSLCFAVMMTGTFVGVNHFYHLIRPNTSEREMFAQYRVLDLLTHLERATIQPIEPLCLQPSGCERVALTQFTMPQNGDMRPVIFAHAPAEIAFPIRLPVHESFLWLSPALDPEAWGWGGDGVTFEVAIRDESGESVLWNRHFYPDNQHDLGWQDVRLSLNKWSGEEVILLLRTSAGPNGNSDADRAGWGIPWLMEATFDERYGQAY